MIVLMSIQTTLIVVALMAALSIAAISTFADTALAAGKPSGVPGPGTGTATSSCASTPRGPAAAGCAPDFRGP
jgi:hypothetical protein